MTRTAEHYTTMHTLIYSVFVEVNYTSLFRSVLGWTSFATYKQTRETNKQQHTHTHREVVMVVHFSRHPVSREELVINKCGGWSTGEKWHDVPTLSSSKPSKHSLKAGWAVAGRGTKRTASQTKTKRACVRVFVCGWVCGCDGYVISSGSRQSGGVIFLFRCLVGWSVG